MMTMNKAFYSSDIEIPIVKNKEIIYNKKPKNFVRLNLQELKNYDLFLLLIKKTLINF